MDILEKKYLCRLCQRYVSEQEISEEHYPARSVGNEDIVAVDIEKLIDSLLSEDTYKEIVVGLHDRQSIEEIAGQYFDEKLSIPLYPNGRTAKTLCRKCNTFLGHYDKAYLKFYNVNGDPKAVRGFQKSTKIGIIKAIFGKFLSVPEASNEHFDFIDFLTNESCDTYQGVWHLYFVRRGFSSDFMGMADIGTGKLEFPEGLVYELSDDKFIFDLMNFERHREFEMNSIFDLLSDHYSLITGVGEKGGYHAQILMSRLFHTALDDQSRMM